MTSCEIAHTHGRKYGSGNICASSNTTTLPAMLCSLRHCEGLQANKDSKNCTAVVTTTGASQFSVARSIRQVVPICLAIGSNIILNICVMLKD